MVPRGLGRRSEPYGVGGTCEQDSADAVAPRRFQCHLGPGDVRPDNIAPRLFPVDSAEMNHSIHIRQGRCHEGAVIHGANQHGFVRGRAGGLGNVDQPHRVAGVHQVRAQQGGHHSGATGHGNGDRLRLC
ncbi:hypothetical protein D9M72_599060 [compost metagenome]